MNIPDPIERGEARAEAWYYDNVKDGKFQCNCGKWISVEEGVPASQDPYSPLVCSKCSGLDDFLEKLEKERENS
jgi:hypothetical protein